MKLNPYQPPRPNSAASESHEAPSALTDSPIQWIVSILFWTTCAGIVGTILSVIIFKLSISDLFSHESLDDLYLDLAYDLRFDWFNPAHRRQAALQLPLLFVSVGWWGTIFFRTVALLRRWIANRNLTSRT